jgi:hypothetical protein
MGWWEIFLMLCHCWLAFSFTPGCCCDGGPTLGSACAFCDTNTTAAEYAVTFSGIAAGSYGCNGASCSDFNTTYILPQVSACAWQEIWGAAVCNYPGDPLGSGYLTVSLAFVTSMSVDYLSAQINNAFLNQRIEFREEVIPTINCLFESKNLPFVADLHGGLIGPYCTGASATCTVTAV